MTPVERVDLFVLFAQLRHRHSAGDLQAVGMIGHRTELVSEADSRADDVGERLAAVAPGGVHLQVAAVVLDSRPLQRRVGQRREHLRTTEEVVAQPAPALDVCRLAAFGDGPFDRRRGARLEHLLDDARRRRADIRNFLQRAVRLEQRLNRLLEGEDGRCGAFIAPHALLRLLNRGEIAQQRRNLPVLVHALDLPRHQLLLLRWLSRLPIRSLQTRDPRQRSSSCETARPGRKSSWFAVTKGPPSWAAPTCFRAAVWMRPTATPTPRGATASIRPAASSTGFPRLRRSRFTSPPRASSSRRLASFSPDIRMATTSRSPHRPITPASSTTAIVSTKGRPPCAPSSSVKACVWRSTRWCCSH